MQDLIERGKELIAELEDAIEKMAEAHKNTPMLPVETLSTDGFIFDENRFEKFDAVVILREDGSLRGSGVPAGLKVEISHIAVVIQEVNIKQLVQEQVEIARTKVVEALNKLFESGRLLGFIGAPIRLVSLPVTGLSLSYAIVTYPIVAGCKPGEPETIPACLEALTLSEKQKHPYTHLQDKDRPSWDKLYRQYSVHRILPDGEFEIERPDFFFASLKHSGNQDVAALQYLNGRAVGAWNKNEVVAIHRQTGAVLRGDEIINMLKRAYS